MYHCLLLKKKYFKFGSMFSRVHSIFFGLSIWHDCDYIDKIGFFFLSAQCLNPSIMFVLYMYYYAFLYGHIISVNKSRAFQKSKIIVHIINLLKIIVMSLKKEAH